MQYDAARQDRVDECGFDAGPWENLFRPMLRQDYVAAPVSATDSIGRTQAAAASVGCRIAMSTDRPVPADYGALLADVRERIRSA